MSSQEIEIYLNLNDPLSGSNDNFNIKKYTFNNNEYNIIKYDIVYIKHTIYDMPSPSFKH